MGCERFETKNVHKSKDRTHCEDVKPKQYKKLWNLHWALRTAWQKKQEGKNKDKGQEIKTKCPGDESWWTGSDNMWRLSRLHGFLFWGILCCNFFFHLLYIFAHQETPRWKTLSKTERKNEHSALLSQTTFQSKCSFFFFFFCFYEQLSLIVTFGKATVPSLTS